MANNSIQMPGLTEALGQSEAFLSFQEQLAAVAVVDRPILLVGERGTGKELAAVRLHYHSRRWQGPFVALNCSALAETLLESELFGHEAGAFTGAARLRRGRFEAAHEGTLFLDELGGMSLLIQEKLLRVLEYKVFERVGASKSIFSDVRVIAATNADLRFLSAQGRFKSDLLDRLSFEVLHVPPLRAREGDVVFLARHFATRMMLELGWHDTPRFSPRVLRILEAYAWPGNIRELKNVVERAVFRAGGGVVKEVVFDPLQSPFDSPPKGLHAPSWSPPGGECLDAGREGNQNAKSKNHVRKALPDAVADLEREYLNQALEKTSFNQRRAAEYLGLSYHQFRGLYRKYKGRVKEEDSEPDADSAVKS
jgi:psp operon transcriptional activator